MIIDKEVLEYSHKHGCSDLERSAAEACRPNETLAALTAQLWLETAGVGNKELRWSLKPGHWSKNT